MQQKYKLLNKRRLILYRSNQMINLIIPQDQVAARTAEKISKTIPDFTICGIVMQPLPNTIAFGGVPAGNAKSHDAEIVEANKIGTKLF